MRNITTYSIASIIIILIASVYWPVIHAQFVWDDILDFVQMKWLTYGDEWEHYVFRDFNNWPNYFRPLVIALFTLELRLFNVAPGPMHAVSLGMHLVDTLLVGLLSRQCCNAIGLDDKRKTLFLPASMLLYGLHPVLIEPVAWIGCQFDLAATLFILLGLLTNVRIGNSSFRAAAVATCFFLAACSKESAASFPLMLAIFAWVLQPRYAGETWLMRLLAFTRQHWKTYIALCMASIAYLALRRWALGHLIHPVINGASTPLSRIQETCFLYLQYWRLLAWPMPGMGPIHEADAHQFLSVTTSSVLTCIVAIAIVFMSLYRVIRYASSIGCIIAMMTAGLLPVLHIIPTEFAPSLYHERYAMTSLAAMCAMLPLLCLPTAEIGHRATSALRILAWSAAGLWIMLAVVSIRITLPHWSTDIRLWQWALVQNPHSTTTEDSLLGAYISNHDYVHADVLRDKLLAEHTTCINCMLNIAILAVAENDPARAAPALDVVKHSREVVTNQQTLRVYYLTTGHMLIEQHKFDDAEAVLHAAIKLEPHEPEAYMALATALAQLGRADEANRVIQQGLVLLPVDQRQAIQKAFAALIDAVDKSSPTSQTVDTSTAKP